MVEQLPNMSFQIQDQVLVLQGQHLARQDLMPVIHHALVLEKVLANIVEVIDERLSLGEELPVTTQGCIERIAPRVYDLGVREDQVDEAIEGKLLGILSMKRGRSSCRWTLARSMYSRPRASKFAALSSRTEKG